MEQGDQSKTIKRHTGHMTIVRDSLHAKNLLLFNVKKHSSEYKEKFTETF